MDNLTLITDSLKECLDANPLPDTISLFDATQIQDLFNQWITHSLEMSEDEFTYRKPTHG